jgi:hypothetical protein
MLAVVLPVILLDIFVCLLYVGVELPFLLLEQNDRQFNGQHKKDKQ